MANRSNKRRKGNAIVEFALIAPLLFPMILVVVDFGLYAYAFISVENAARVGALRNSGGIDSAADQTGACSMAIDELRGMPNVGSSFSSTCNAAPISVTAQYLCPTATNCSGSMATIDSYPAASVSVTYTVPGLFQFPFISPQTITRSAQMRIRSMQ